MAFFSIITGLIVLIGSVVISKYQRIQESVLLRTIGASRQQIDERLPDTGGDRQIWFDEALEPLVIAAADQKLNRPPIW